MCCIILGKATRFWHSYFFISWYVQQVIFSNKNSNSIMIEISLREIKQRYQRLFCTICRWSHFERHGQKKNFIKITQKMRWGLINLRWMELNRWALTGSDINAATANIFSLVSSLDSIWHKVAYWDSWARISLNLLICVALKTFSFWKAIILVST